jgi:hypothetical protein
MSVELVAFLRAVRDHIADPDRYTPTGIALDERGQTVTPLRTTDSRGRQSCAAVRWSDWGARAYVQSCGGVSIAVWDDAADLVRVVAHERHGTSIHQIGVRHGHAAVLAVYDAAIARAGASVPG